MQGKHLIIFFKNVTALGKIPVSLAVAYTSLTGYVMYNLIPDVKGLIISAGVFLMAAGSAALNQVQEKDTDRLMERTKDRPVASGRLSVKIGIIVASGYFLAGSLLIIIPANSTSLLIAWITVFWYNAVYTPLKKISPFAVFPGALVGALPPFIGYTAAGGSILVLPVLFLSVFIFMAQIPHFWLIILRRANDYGNSKVISVKKYLNEKQIRRLSNIWIFLLIASSFTLHPAGTITTITGSVILKIISAMVFMLWLYGFMRMKTRDNFFFILINMYVFVILTLILSERLILFVNFSL